MPKLLVIRQYDCVVLTIIYYKISAPLNNRIFLEVPIRKIKRYRAYFSLDVGDKIESETLLSQNDPADILELRMLFEIAYQSLDMLTRKQGLRVYKYLFLGMSIEEISEEEERSTTSVKNSGYSSLSKRFALSLICFSINLSRSFGRL